MDSILTLEALTPWDMVVYIVATPALCILLIDHNAITIFSFSKHKIKAK